MKILHEAHRDLEIFMLDREVLRVKSYLTDKMSDYVYNGKRSTNGRMIFRDTNKPPFTVLLGFWFSPECDFVRNSIMYSQKYVNGAVRLQLYKGNGEYR